MRKGCCFCSAAVLLSLLSSACAIAPKNDGGLLNGDFETGRLTGWTVESGDAYSRKNPIRKADGRYCQGKRFFDSSLCPQGSSGTLRSTAFTVSNNGKIGLLIGAGKNSADHFLTLNDEKTGEALLTFSNDDCDITDGRMYRKTIDASAFIGRRCFLRIVEKNINSDDLSYLALDDIILGYDGEDEYPDGTSDANRFTASMLDRVERERQPTYHLRAPWGWMNDPNGFSWFDGRFHVYYQFNPYDTSWGDIHWGHATSEDLIVFQNQGAAIAPDHDYDSGGVFSGDVFVEDGKVYAVYTGNADLQRQALAVSADGKHFVAYEDNPIMDADFLPPEYVQTDFRDPSLFKRDGTYYALLGTRLKAGAGANSLFKAPSLTGPWSYVGLTQSDSRANVLECPDYLSDAGSDILICSPQNIGFSSDGSMFQNISSVVYSLGRLNTETGEFEKNPDVPAFQEFDKGYDFYAGQMTEAPDGRILLIAWLNMWDRSFPSAEWGWAGSLALPRELTVSHGHIYQSPIHEIENYFGAEKSWSDSSLENGSLNLEGFDSETVRIKLTLDVSQMTAGQKAGLRLFESDDGEEFLDLYYDRGLKRLVLDRTRCGKPFTHSPCEKEVRYADPDVSDGKLDLEIYLDRGSAEIFVQDGWCTMTTQAYPSKGGTGVSLYATSGGKAVFSDVSTTEIIVPGM